MYEENCQWKEIDVFLTFSAGSKDPQYIFMFSNVNKDFQFR